MLLVGVGCVVRITIVRVEEEELHHQIDEGLELCIGKVSRVLFGVKEATDGTHPSL